MASERIQRQIDRLLGEAAKLLSVHPETVKRFGVAPDLGKVS